MKFNALRVSALVAVVAACASSVAACSSSSSGSPGSGGSSGGTSPTDYCSAISAYVSKCNLTDACDVAEEKECSSIAAAFSAQELSAEISCASVGTCGDAGDSAISDCVNAKQASFTPTAAQTKIAADFCAQCAEAFSDTPAQCQTAFFAGTGTTSGTGFTAGEFGSLILDLSDAVTTSIDTTCTPSLSADAGQACVESFATCAATQLNTLVPTPAACQTTTNGQSFGFHHLRAR
jgi:hypothetical protein